MNPKILHFVMVIVIVALCSIGINIIGLKLQVDLFTRAAIVGLIGAGLVVWINRR